MKRGGRMKRKVCFSIIIIAIVGLVLLVIWRAFADSHPISTETLADADRIEDDDSSDTITWNGKTYEYNDHLSNFLFIGVDNSETVETTTGEANAGQADALYLVAWDRKENTVTEIAIPRDTMTEIEIYGPGGTSLGSAEDHISLSYAYGDGSYESCELTEEAVSNLFYDLRIQGYCSINMEGIPVLTESVGGVTVTVPNDSLEEAYPEFQEGSQVTLDAENTEAFVRYRDITVSQSALTRQERQEEYIRAFGEAAMAKYTEEASCISEIYSSLEPYMVTNMSTGDFVNIMQSISEGSVLEGWTVPGEGTEGETYDEYIVDEDAFYTKIIETFYQEVEED